MYNNNMKDQIMLKYLQQQNKINDNEELECENDISSDDEDESTPSDKELEVFKQQVNSWLEYDNSINKLKQAIKERKKAQDVLTERIGCFMNKYNIEDLNTKGGKIRCKIIEAKTPLTQKLLKERIYETMQDNIHEPSKIIENVFKREGMFQKVVLKRLKNNAVLNI